MNKSFPSYPKALDIWGIIKEVVGYDDSDNCISDVRLYLEMDMTGSFVIVYGDGRRHPEVDGIKLTIEETIEMYRKIDDLVEIPKAVLALHAWINPNTMVEFDIKMVPILKEQP